MSNDYLTLANVARPQMMPEAPMGAGLWAGMDYQNQQARQDHYLAQAGAMADLGAQQTTQRHTEYMAGAPGRMAGISVDNAMNEQKASNIPLMREAATAELTDKVEGYKDKDRKRKQEALEERSEQWMALQPGDTKGQNQIIMEMKDMGITKIGGRPLEEISPQELDQIMRRVNKAAVQNRETMRKNLIEKAKAEERRALEELKIEAKKEMQDKLIKARADLAKAVKDGRNPGEVINLIHKDLYDAAKAEPDPTKRQEKLLEVDRFIQEAKIAVAQAKAANQPSQTDVNFDTGDISSRPPTVPKPATFGGVKSGTSTTAPDELDKNIKIGGTFNNSEIIGIKRNPQTGKVIQVYTKDKKLHNVGK